MRESFPHLSEVIRGGSGSEWSPRMRVFVDSNIAMYAAGAAHPHKEPCLRFRRSVQRNGVQAVTSVEVLQEILHRYQRLGHSDVARQVYDLVVQLCAEVLPVTIADTDVCVDLLHASGGSVRDALHAAVMRNNDIEVIATYDAYDVSRLSPE